ncbi:MAG: dihydroorotate dehydrogenase electron transfer subunit [bacterium]
MGVIIQNTKKAPDHYMISINQQGDHPGPKPGQFYMIRCSTCTDPLLRRPLSLHSYFREKEGNTYRLDFLYRVIGNGTRLLSRMRPGDSLEVFGPLGNGFEITQSIEYALIVAGGIGVAPLPYLAECLMKKQGHPAARILIGAKLSEHILALERFEGLGMETSIYTEDGKMGIKGFVTDNLDQALEHCLKKKSMVFACGPTGMLAKVARQCISRGIPCQVSLDRRMACGVGACQGCVVRAADTSSSINKIYKRVCIDGPVFQANDLDWPNIEREERCLL